MNYVIDHNIWRHIKRVHFDILFQGMQRNSIKNILNTRIKIQPLQGTSLCSCSIWGCREPWGGGGWWRGRWQWGPACGEQAGLCQTGTESYSRNSSSSARIRRSGLQMFPWNCSFEKFLDARATLALVIGPSETFFRNTFDMLLIASPTCPPRTGRGWAERRGSRPPPPPACWRSPSRRGRSSPAGWSRRGPAGCRWTCGWQPGPSTRCSLTGQIYYW